MKITKRFDFEAAHELPWHEGKCKNLHGHSYKFEIDIEGEISDNGILVDFYHVSSIVKENIVEKYDHKFLNNFFENPTAELMCKSFLETVRGEWSARKLPGIVARARLWETERSWVEAV